MSKYRKSYISLQDACDNKRLQIGTVWKYLQKILELINNNPNLLNVRKSINAPKGDDNSNVEYENPAAMVVRNYMTDRKFPMETVELKIHEINHDEEIGKVILHTGAYADEWARSNHALAFTLGTDIYFRNGAYKPETEEGRKLLAHELKHVSQNNEYMTADNRTTEQLENEAEEEESKEVYESDPFVTLKTENKSYRVRKSEYEKIMKMAEKELEAWVDSQEKCMSPENYFKLLCNYQKYLEEKND